MADILREPCMDESLRIFTQNIKKIPTIPAVAEGIIGIIGNRSAYVYSVVETIERDPAISSKVLSVANAAFFRLGDPVVNIKDAVMKIGFDNIRGIALGVSLLTTFRAEHPLRKAEYARIFRHCLAVGIVSREIENHIGGKRPEDIFTSGLLHDLGLLVIHSFLPDIFDRILLRLKRGKPYTEIEKEVYGFTHADVGGWLADKWNLPESIQTAVYCHHNLARAELYPHTAAVVHLADNIAVAKGYSPISGDLFDCGIDDAAMKTVGVSRTDMAEMEKMMNTVLVPVGDIYL